VPVEPALGSAVREPHLVTKTKTLGRLIGAFKTVSSEAIDQIRGTAHVIVWQRNYYEHIIRGERELSRIREYIRRNPQAWPSDPENLGSKTSASPSDWQVLGNLEINGRQGGRFANRPYRNRQGIAP